MGVEEGEAGFVPAPPGCNAAGDPPTLATAAGPHHSVPSPVPSGLEGTIPRVPPPLVSVTLPTPSVNFLLSLSLV